MQVTAEVLVISGHLSMINDVYYACDNGDEQTASWSTWLSISLWQFLYQGARTSIDRIGRAVIDVSRLLETREPRTRGVTVAKY